jgi:hypothetical protein
MLHYAVVGLFLAVLSALVQEVLVLVLVEALSALKRVLLLWIETKRITLLLIIDTLAKVIVK